MDFSNIRKKYTDELTAFYQGGAFPEKSSADLRFGLACQRKRVNKKGLTMVKKFERTCAENAKASQFVKFPYTYTVASNRCNYETDFYKDGKLISRSDLSEETLYMGILDKQVSGQGQMQGQTSVPGQVQGQVQVPGQVQGQVQFPAQANSVGQQSYTCKNCGHTDLMSKFTSGCPMCGTTYEMQQNYPCVSGYYTRPTVLSKKVYKGAMKFGFLYFGAIGAILGLIAGLSISEEQGYGVGGTIAMSLFAITIFGGGLLLFSFIMFNLMLGPALAAKKVAQHSEVLDVQAAAATKTRMETDLKRYVPDFSYEFFEEKVISLLRGIVFSDDREKLTIYDGKDDLSFMDNIVDVEYRGAVEYVGSSVVDGILRVSVKAYVVSAFYHGGNMVEFKKQVFQMILAKKVKEEDYGFTIHAVNCKKCSGSFDAIHVKTCPYCGAEYHLIEDNWVVSQINCVETATANKW
ncbi:MAG: hypothetical protein IK020_00535 [Clostridiales bacterium]|nr:hypothetical protein [Clostridiales bacterium]